MSSDVVIRAEGLGKKYMIGHQSGERFTSLRDVMAQSARNFARTAGEMLRGKAIIAGDEVEEFWALKDVSFEIKRGDVVGIIGRNGAGKSTLLKVLSRITEPSEGRVEIKGRVASLLEVGTGFHPELTGRENIYLNGAILGMSREEIKRKFDEIVDFSGVEKFLDTPVKRYSSGMYVRLAFAVAAHLEPEILIVDEVLAVGDAEFQKKCLGKMQDVAGQGRTVLLVSHNLRSIQQLCRSGVLLSKGCVQAEGAIRDVITTYFGDAVSGGDAASGASSFDLRGAARYGSGSANIVSVQLLCGGPDSSGRPTRGAELNFRISISGVVQPSQNISMVFTAPDGARVLQVSEFDDPNFRHGKIKIDPIFTCKFPCAPFQPGFFIVDVGLHEGGSTPVDVIRDAFTFQVFDADISLRNFDSSANVAALHVPTFWSLNA